MLLNRRWTLKTSSGNLRKTLTIRTAILYSWILLNIEENLWKRESWILCQSLSSGKTHQEAVLRWLSTAPSWTKAVVLKLWVWKDFMDFIILLQPIGTMDCRRMQMFQSIVARYCYKITSYSNILSWQNTINDF